jgi:hypothetical protein
MKMPNKNTGIIIFKRLNKFFMMFFLRFILEKPDIKKKGNK